MKSKKRFLLLASLLILCLVSIRLVGEITCSPRSEGEQYLKSINKDLFLLSDKGCSRATAYGSLSKIAFVKGVCIIAWLDIEEDKFVPTVAVYDLKRKKVINKYVFDKSVDNHGVPSVAVDDQDKIHVFYYPHANQKIKYKTGELTDQNEIIWECKDEIGDPNLTYPNAVFHKDKGLLVFARKSPIIYGPDPPPSYGYYTCADGFSQFNAVLSSRDSGYASFHSRVLFSNKKIQMLSTVLESTERIIGKSETITYIETADKGKTWRKNRNQKIPFKRLHKDSSESSLQPADLITPDKASVIDSGGVQQSIRLGAIGLYNERNKVNAYYIKEDLSGSSLIRASRKNRSDEWIKSLLTDKIYPSIENRKIVAPTGNLVESKGVVLLSAVMQDDIEGNTSKWGHKTNSVVLLAHEKDSCKRLIEFKSKSNCVWFPYVQVQGNDLLLIFTKKARDYNVKDNKDVSAVTEVYLFHTKLDELLKKEFEVILL